MNLFFLDALVFNFAEKHCIRGNVKGSYLFYDTLLYTCILALLFLKDVVTEKIPLSRFLLILILGAVFMFLWALFTFRFLPDTAGPKK